MEWISTTYIHGRACVATRRWHRVHLDDLWHGTAPLQPERTPCSPCTLFQRGRGRGRGQGRSVRLGKLAVPVLSCACACVGVRTAVQADGAADDAVLPSSLHTGLLLGAGAAAARAACSLCLLGAVCVCVCEAVVDVRARCTLAVWLQRYKAAPRSKSLGGGGNVQPRRQYVNPCRTHHCHPPAHLGVALQPTSAEQTSRPPATRSPGLLLLRPDTLPAHTPAPLRLRASSPPRPLCRVCTECAG